MKEHKKLIISLLCVCLMGIGLYFLFKEDQTVMDTSAVTDQAVEFDDIDLNEEKDGKTVWRLKARHVKMENNKNIIYLTDVDGQFSQDENELTLSAKKGIIKRTEQTVFLEGNVEGTTKDGLILHAKNLTYDGKKQILSTDQSFMVEKENRVLTADSFTADRVLEKIVAKGNAKLADKEENK